MRDLEQRLAYKDIENLNLKRHVKELEHILFAITSNDNEKTTQKDKSGIQNLKVIQL